MTELVTRDQWQALLDSVDTFLFDCCGVLWTGDADPIPGSQEALQFLRAKGKAIYFVTNSSSMSRVECLETFHQLGIQAHEHEVFCTTYTTAYYLKHVLQFTGKVYLMGMPGLAHELELVGVSHTGTGPDVIHGGVSDWLDTQLDPEAFVQHLRHTANSVRTDTTLAQEVRLDNTNGFTAIFFREVQGPLLPAPSSPPLAIRVGAVVVGVDKHFSFSKLIKACSYLKRPSYHFIATNEDATLPAHSDIVIPGAGCMVKSVALGAGRQPLVLGKPSNSMFEVVQHSTKLDPTRTVMVGDSLHTDMFFGHRSGLRTVLVFSGVTQRGDLPSARPEQQPEFICDSIASILTCKS